MLRKTDYILKTLNVVSWIIFIGVCIEAGGFIFNAIFTLLISPSGANKFWTEVNLSALYGYNQSAFVTVTSLMIIVAVLRAVMFYFIVKVFHDKQVTLSKPFNENARNFVLKIAYLALAISLFSYFGGEYTQNLVSQGVKIPDIHHLRLSGADVWLFMSITLMVIALVFKKGIEIQNENDLTV